MSAPPPPGTTVGPQAARATRARRGRVRVMGGAPGPSRQPGARIPRGAATRRSAAAHIHAPRRNRAGYGCAIAGSVVALPAPGANGNGDAAGFDSGPALLLLLLLPAAFGELS